MSQSTTASPPLLKPTHNSTAVNTILQKWTSMLLYHAQFSFTALNFLQFISKKLSSTETKFNGAMKQSNHVLRITHHVFSR